MNSNEISPSAFPLIVFVHVPKTGGVTIENALLRLSPRGHGNAHALSGSMLLNIVNDLDWISGHLTRSYFNSVLGWLPLEGTPAGGFSTRKLEYYSVVRDPVRQIISHLNYSFARQEIANYINNKNYDEEMLDADVMATDFTNQYAIKSLLFRHREHYSNCQSRFILGSKFEKLTDDQIEQRVRSYTYIGDTADLPMLYSSFGFAGELESLYDIRENASKKFFDESIFYDKFLHSFLRDYLSVDFRLYDAVKGVNFHASFRQPSRPSLRVLQNEQYNEIGYLAANPDIAMAIESGVFANGREHFDRHGLHENRRIAIFP